MIADVGGRDLVGADLVPERTGRFQCQVLASELPEADPVAKAVAAITRNGGTIKNAAKGISVARDDGTSPGQGTLFTPTEVS